MEFFYDKLFSEFSEFKDFENNLEFEVKFY